MKLNVADRIRLLGILPKKGNLLTLKIVSTLRDDLSFSEKEHKDFEITIKEARITWSNKAKEKDIEVGEQANKIIVDKLNQMNEKEEMTLPDIDLWEKFIGEK
jgi:uncharacterized protein YdgA (DUF945 family)